MKTNGLIKNKSSSLNSTRHLESAREFYRSLSPGQFKEKVARFSLLDGATVASIVGEWRVTNSSALI